MLAVATGDVIAIDPPETFFLIDYIGSVRSELVQPDIADFVDDLSAGRVTCRIEVFGDGRLAIGHHLLAGEFLGDRVIGTAKNLGGKAQEAFGHVTGDTKSQVEGVINQAAVYDQKPTATP